MDLSPPLHVGHLQELVSEAAKRTWVCPCDDWVWQRHELLGLRGESSGARCEGKPAATGAGDKALLEPFLASGTFYSKGFPGWSFFIVWHSKHKQHTQAGSFSLLLGASGTQRGALSLRSFSCSAAGTGMVGERDYSDGSTPCV